MSAETPVQIPVPQKPSSRLRTLLLVSLAVNALLIGGLVSAVIRHGRQLSGPMGDNPQKNLGVFVSTLPAERGRAILGRASELRRALGPIRRDVRQARDVAFAALTADPFDRDKFLSAQTRLLELEHSFRLGQKDILAEMAGTMTPEERRTFLRWRGPLHGSSDRDGQAPMKQ